MQFSFTSRINSRVFLFGFLWIVFSSFLSATNDASMKFLGTDFYSVQIVFCRFASSLLCSLFFFTNLHRELNYNNLKLIAFSFHGLRTILGIIAIGLSCYAVQLLPLTKITTLSFTQPIITLFLAVLFLREQLRTSAIFIGLIMLLAIGLVFDFTSLELNKGLFIYLLALILFSSQDILIKKLVNNSHYVNSEAFMLFSFALGGTLITFPLAYYYWIPLSITDIITILFLGFSSNLLQYALFKAYKYNSITALAPFRYSEFIFAVCYGYFGFGENLISVATFQLIAAITLIIPCSLYLSYPNIFLKIKYWNKHFRFSKIKN